MDDQLLQLAFGSSPLHNALVNGVGGDQAVYHHRSSLTDAVTPVLSLQVALGVLENTQKDHIAVQVHSQDSTQRPHCSSGVRTRGSTQTMLQSRCTQKVTAQRDHVAV